MKLKNTFFIFCVFVVLYIVFFIMCFSTYSQCKFMLWQDKGDNIWIYIRNTIVSNNLIFDIHKSLRHTIPVWAMPIAIIINSANMLYGFKKYKNKWWYYLILALTIIMTIIILDCFHILIHQDDMA